MRPEISRWLTRAVFKRAGEMFVDRVSRPGLPFQLIVFAIDSEQGERSGSARPGIRPSSLAGLREQHIRALLVRMRANRPTSCHWPGTEAVRSRPKVGDEGRQATRLGNAPSADKWPSDLRRRAAGIATDASAAQMQSNRPLTRSRCADIDSPEEHAADSEAVRVVK